ncbi:MAG: 30S ribosomal protein S4 [Candidatus Thorarchaeota archaeon]
MGDIRRTTQKYSRPRRPFETDRFEQELHFMGTYGLRNKRELWRHRTELSQYRRQARSLLAKSPGERAVQEKELIDKLARLGILKGDRTLDGVLGLTLADLLERRLQTIVFRKGLASSAYHARQLVVHGHIALDNVRVMTPSRLIRVDEEDKIGYAPGSKLNDPAHPARIAASNAAQRLSPVPSGAIGEGEFGGPRKAVRPIILAEDVDGDMEPDKDEDVHDFTMEDERI